MPHRIATISFFLFLTVQLFAQRQTLEFNPVFYPLENSVDLDNQEINFLGLSLYHFNEEWPKITYRLQFLDGSWTEWLELQREVHGIGINKRKAYAAAPVKELIKTFQLRSNDPLKNPRARIFIAGHNSDQIISTTARGFDCEQPDFCDRTCWCKDCPVDSTPEFTTPTHIIVHHSAGFNESDNFKEVVAYYYDLHVNTNGWDDIGYNWLIDPNGVIYEARPDGFQGAHFSCINENTVGICLIGDFSDQLPTEEAQESLVNLIGYEASAHTLDVTMDTYHLTGDFILPTIAGHRDSSGSENACSSTLCPGNTFYPTLETIREQVADLPCYCGDVSSNEDILVTPIRVSPNPFAHSITIDGDENEIYQLISSSGQVIQKLQAQVSTDLSHLPKGLYFISTQGTILKSILKK